MYSMVSFTIKARPWFQGNHSINVMAAANNSVLAVNILEWTAKWFSCNICIFYMLMEKLKSGDLFCCTWPFDYRVKSFFHFSRLLDQVLERFSREGNAQLLEATLCLLEVSHSGLLETELLEILKDIDYRPAAVEAENSKGNFIFPRMWRRRIMQFNYQSILSIAQS